MLLGLVGASLGGCAVLPEYLAAEWQADYAIDEFSPTSLERYAEVRRRYPEAGMLMGVE